MNKTIEGLLHFSEGELHTRISGITIGEYKKASEVYNILYEKCPYKEQLKDSRNRLNYHYYDFMMNDN